MTFARAAVLSIALSAAAAVPVLRFAIDQDYAPQTESVARVAQDFPLVRALSIGILRTGIGWDDTNPARNTYNWPYWSRIISEAAAQNITLRPYDAYTPAWAGAAYNSPPSDDRSYAKACGVMAAQLGPYIPSFEIWNKPDNLAYWTGFAAPFGTMLADCARHPHRAPRRARSTRRPALPRQHPLRRNGRSGTPRHRYRRLSQAHRDPVGQHRGRAG